MSSFCIPNVECICFLICGTRHCSFQNSQKHFPVINECIYRDEQERIKVNKEKRTPKIPNFKGFKTFRFLNSDLGASEVEAWTSQNPSFCITIVKYNGNLGKLSPNFEAFSNVLLFLGTKSSGLKKRKEEEKNIAVTTA